MKVNIITLGCSKNTVDSENIAGHLTHAGLQVFFDRSQNDCETVILNTCGFIGDAKEESIQTILQQAEQKRNYNRRHHTDGKHRLLIASGCLVERYRDELAQEIPEVDVWYGVHEWDRLINDVLASQKRRSKVHDYDFTQQRTLSTPKHYAFLKIAEGCNRSCSYCAIPLIRGKHVSRPIEEILHEAQEMVHNGVKEIILIAQDTTYYGLDLYGTRRLGDLLELLATQSGAEWIRLHYAYPTHFPWDLLRVMRENSNVCRYLDVALQHISDHMLERMQRHITRQETLDFIKRVRSEVPGIHLRTTLMVGFPGETDDDFRELMDFTRWARFERMGAFAYSEEDGTYAANHYTDDVPEEVKQSRLSKLMRLQQNISAEIEAAKVGQTLRVIIDRRENDYYVGRSEFCSPEVDPEVLIPVGNKQLKEGEFYQVRIVDSEEFDIYGEII